MKRKSTLLYTCILAAAFGAVAILASSPLLLRPGEASVTAGDLADIRIRRPEGDVAGVVMLVSGRSDADTSATIEKRLLERGMIVLPIDLDAWRARLDRSDGECIYLGSDLEDLAKETARTVGLDVYHHPVVAGVGEGGTLAWAALADAPAATLAGAVALDPAPTLRTRLPTCPGATSITKSADGFAYGLDAVVPGRATLVSAEAFASSGEKAGLAAAPPAQSEDSHRPRFVVDADAARRLDAAVDAIVHAAEADARAQALPVVDIPAVGSPQAVAVFFSGDGGWRDLDKTMGDWLAVHGVHVVGVDSLRYFWSERTPGEIAADTQSIVEMADPSGKLPVLVLGYSFGADTFPFSWGLLPPELRERIRMVGLLGTEKTTRFQVTVGGWLGMGGDQPVAPAIAAIPPERVVCIHGADEEETACTDPLLSGIQVIETDGGHHFDGDYDALAARLLDTFRTRLPAG